MPRLTAKAWLPFSAWAVAPDPVRFLPDVSGERRPDVAHQNRSAVLGFDLIDFAIDVRWVIRVAIATIESPG